MLANQMAKHGIRDEIMDIVASIAPVDAVEQEHIQDTLNWISSGEPVFRISKPDNPNKHLVSYFVVFDEARQKLLLVDHKNAQLWLPSGGHVEVDEHPATAALRECEEELNITAEFWRPEPIFITQTVTVGLTAGHTDVSLWYVVKGDSTKQYDFDAEEFAGIKWFGFDEIPYEKADPHMQKFVTKLKQLQVG